MHCPTCGKVVAQGLSYCNHCGARLSEAKGSHAGKSSELRPEYLVSAMVGLFILGLGSIAVLIGVMKVVAGFDLPLVLAATVLSFSLLLLIEGLLIGLLLRGVRRAREAADAERPKGQTTRELGEAQARVLPEPVPSVTEHTTRTLESVHVERQSK